MPRYNEMFMRKAIVYLRILKDESAVEIKGKEVSNVRDLCKALKISTYSIYKWKDEITLTDKEYKQIRGDLEKKEKEPKYYQIKVEDKRDIKEEDNNSLNALIPNLEYREDYLAKEFEKEEMEKRLIIRSELRYYSLIGSIAEVKNYSKMTPNQLKFAIGLKWIKESGLIDTSKLIKELSKNGEKLKRINGD